MSKITLKQLSDLHDLQEGDEFAISGVPIKYKIIDGYPCFNSNMVGYVRTDEEEMIMALANKTITIVKKAIQKPKYGEKYYIITSVECRWKDDCFDNESFDNGLVFYDEGDADYRLQEMVDLWKENNK